MLSILESTLPLQIQVLNLVFPVPEFVLEVRHVAVNVVILVVVHRASVGFQFLVQLLGDLFQCVVLFESLGAHNDVGDGREAARALWKDGGIQVLPGTFLARQGRDGWNPGDRYIRVALVHDRVTTANALSCIFDILSKEV